MDTSKKKNEVYKLTKTALLEFFASGEKPKNKWKVGIEYEFFLFFKDSLKRCSFADIQTIMQMLMEKESYSLVKEGDYIISLKNNVSNLHISVEPGGQFELATSPENTIHVIAQQIETFLSTLLPILKTMHACAIPIGFDPITKLNDISWVPKKRYEIMRDYMPKVGTLGLDMMSRTCTIQANVDFSSEKDMVDKIRTSVALQPIITAIFANSPFKEEKIVPYLSYRSHVWTNTDNDRTGILPFIFEEGFGYERYVDFLLDVPMYCIVKDNQYINLVGKSFRGFMNDEIKELKGQVATFNDFVYHSSTVFPDVRLKKHLEMRGVDSNSIPMVYALAAIWLGLLYEKEALGEAMEMIKSWSINDILLLKEEVSKNGLKGQYKNILVQEWAKKILVIARKGLLKRNKLNEKGQAEDIYLAPVNIIVEKGVTEAEKLLNFIDKEFFNNIILKRAM